jgi:Lrp/AsnC family leucine-responsive transcriptional regulator
MPPITGADCFLIKLHAPTNGDLENVLDKFLIHGHTVTSIVVSSPIPDPQLPLIDE